MDVRTRGRTFAHKHTLKLIFLPILFLLYSFGWILFDFSRFYTAILVLRWGCTLNGFCLFLSKMFLVSNIVFVEEKREKTAYINWCKECQCQCKFTISHVFACFVCFLASASAATASTSTAISRRKCWANVLFFMSPQLHFVLCNLWHYL